MNKILLGVLAILLFEGAIAFGRAEPSEQTMKEASVVFLKAVIDDILQNPETAQYFPGVKPSSVVLNEKNERGQLVRWEYSHDLHYVQAGPNLQVEFKPVFESDAGILFRVFVANEQHGQGLFSWIKSYKVLDDSSLTAGFDIELARNSSDLQKKIDAIIKAHLAAFRKAVGAS